ncbi:glycerophosphodiester phosphodiesterase [Sphingobacterium faecale]|uniref:Glycerophosphodiester phosphodiesterase n=1 Tax=Sphingobacterium faecale TaxID=2803775 RepID=A0ABS1R654_9SPHI|nr:glycerophosphodiester phosphodiesterase [Sphingobacterium faecale]MBL1410177.1 glycerophosphodiester phosphodiesterase [Sphingobacterium faecale]
MNKLIKTTRLIAIVVLCLSGYSYCFAQKAEVKLFAHRGGMAETDENTISAFETTYNRGLRGYETDIRITKDGHLVIFHDDSFDRMLGIKGSIETLTLKEIKKLKTKKGNPIPTLDEFLTFFKDKDGVYIEFEMKTNKPLYDETTLEKYCDMLYTKAYAAKPANSDYVLTSFDPRPLKYLKQKYPNVDLLLIKSEALSQKVLDEAKGLGVTRVGCRAEKTTRSMVTEAKKQGFTVSLWPGHSVEDFFLGVALGSDYLCSDVPYEVTERVRNSAPWITLK